MPRALQALKSTSLLASSSVKHLPTALWYAPLALRPGASLVITAAGTPFASSASAWAGASRSSLVKGTAHMENGYSRASSTVSYKWKPSTMANRRTASIHSSGTTSTGVQSKALIRKRASIIEDTMPSVSGCFQGNSTKPVMIYTKSPEWICATRPLAACTDSGSPA